MPDENILKLKEYQNSILCRTEKSIPFLLQMCKKSASFSRGLEIVAAEMSEPASECTERQRRLHPY
jgi:hypothetical protein